eukprot:jgi/Picsp_1/2860/NSC_01085-R1_wd and tetratricopeptide repeats protein 1
MSWHRSNISKNNLINTLVNREIGSKTKMAGVDKLVALSGPRRREFVDPDFGPDSDSQMQDAGWHALVAHTAVYRCHLDRVKHVEVSPSEPYLFWSASEDGDVRQFDYRISTGRQSTEHSPNVLLSLHSRRRMSRGISAININPLKPEMMAVAGPDDIIRIFDRRKSGLDTRSSKRDNMFRAQKDEVLLNLSIPHYSIECLIDETRYDICPTYVSFGACGDKVIASYHGYGAATWSCLLSDECSCKSFYGRDEELQRDVSTEMKMMSTMQDIPGVSAIVETSHESASLASHFKDYGKYEMATENDTIGEARYISKSLKYNPNDPGTYVEYSKSLGRRSWAQDRLDAVHAAELAVRLDPANQSCQNALIEALLNVQLILTAKVLAEKFWHQSTISDLSKRIDEILAAKYSLDSESIKAMVTLAFKGSMKAKYNDRIPEIDIVYANTWGTYLKQSESPSSGHADKNRPSSEHSNTNSPILLLGNRFYSNYLQSYQYHRNFRTDIKEAVFLGSRDSHVAAASDSGFVFIYEAASGQCIAALEADREIVNCIRPHPTLPVIATSGIEHSIKIWSPIEGPSGKHCITDVDKIDKVAELEGEDDEPFFVSPPFGHLGARNEYLMAALARHSSLVHLLYRQSLRQRPDGNGDDQNDEDMYSDSQTDQDYGSGEVDCQIS